MGRDVQLLPATCNNTFLPFSVVPVSLYLLILKVKDQIKDLGSWKLSSAILPVSVPWHTKGVAEPQARSLQAVLESCCGTWTQPSREMDTRPLVPGAYRIHVPRSSTSNTQLCLRTAHSRTSFRTEAFQWTNLSCPGAFPGCSAGPLGRLSLLTLSASTIPNAKVFTHPLVLWLAAASWPQQAGHLWSTRSDSVRDRAFQRKKLALSTITKENEGSATKCLEVGQERACQGQQK